MDSELKVGDRVASVSGGFALNKGDTGVVTALEEQFGKPYVRVRLDNLGLVIGYPVTTFKPIEAKE